MEHEYPKMLYSRRHHAIKDVAASVYDPRHDYVWAHIDNEDQAKALGSDWVENPADLPERSEIPINADVPSERPIDDQSRYFEHVRDDDVKDHSDNETDQLIDE